MNNPQIPKEREVTDAIWAEYEASQSGPRKRNKLIRRRSVAGGLILVATVGCCLYLWMSDEHTANPFWSVIVTGIIVILGGTVAGFLLLPGRLLRWLRGQMSPPTTAPTKRISTPHIAVIYTPAPEPPDPQTMLLEERLLHLCQQDRRLSERLLQYERDRTPGERRAELLRLAIEHFERDKE